MPTPEYTQASSAIAGAKTAIGKVDAEFALLKEQFTALSREYESFRGTQAGPEMLKSLLKTYGSKAALYFGGPGAAVALTALTAATGAFASLKGVLGKVLGLFGFGG